MSWGFAKDLLLEFQRQIIQVFLVLYPFHSNMCDGCITEKWDDDSSETSPTPCCYDAKLLQISNGSGSIFASLISGPYLSRLFYELGVTRWHGWNPSSIPSDARGLCWEFYGFREFVYKRNCYKICTPHRLITPPFRPKDILLKRGGVTFKKLFRGLRPPTPFHNVIEKYVYTIVDYPCIFMAYIRYHIWKYSFVFRIVQSMEQK